MARKPDNEHPDQNPEQEMDRQKGKEEQVSDEDICKAIKCLREKNGNTIREIRKYLSSTFEKFRSFPTRQLESTIKRATIKGVNSGKISRRGCRFLMAATEEADKVDNVDVSSSRRNRKPKGPCRQHRVYRPLCSKYRKRCCRRKKRCRASRYKSKRPVCSRYKKKCCRRRRR